jgi:DNA ligase-1
LLRTSEVLAAGSWAEVEAARSTSRARGVEGLMLKRVDSVYGAGRVKLGPVDDKALGAWWKWKIEPYVIDCVLVSAQRGSGRRASLYTDYTFALWSGPERGEGELVPFAKAYHGKGMTDEVFVKIDQFIRGHTIGRIGGAGIRLVEPRLVFELAFEGVQASPRHRSGLAVRFPRVNRWRTDKSAEEADTLQTLRALAR